MSVRWLLWMRLPLNGGEESEGRTTKRRPMSRSSNCHNRIIHQQKLRRLSLHLPIFCPSKEEIAIAFVTPETSYVSYNGGLDESQTKLVGGPKSWQQEALGRFVLFRHSFSGHHVLPWKFAAGFHCSKGRPAVAGGLEKKKPRWRLHHEFYGKAGLPNVAEQGKKANVWLPIWCLPALSARL